MKLEERNTPIYIDDIDTPLYDFLKIPLVTKNYHLQPLGNEHFLDLFEFRLQNENDDKDPFDNLGEKFEEAYTQFFTYLCNVDNLAWVLMDRLYVVGFFLLEIDVDYNNYMNRNAHLYYEISNRIDGPAAHVECIKAFTSRLFGESDIPKIELHLDEDESDTECMTALGQLGFIRNPEKDENGYSYYLISKDPQLNYPPRHMAYILKAYQDEKIKSAKSSFTN